MHYASCSFNLRGFFSQILISCAVHLFFPFFCYGFVLSRIYGWNSVWKASCNSQLNINHGTSCTVTLSLKLRPSLCKMDWLVSDLWSLLPGLSKHFHDSRWWLEICSGPRDWMAPISSVSAIIMSIIPHHSHYNDVIAGCSLVSGLEPSSRGELRERLSRGLSLTHLDLTDCQRLDDLSLRLILQASSGMENLYLRRCSNITG